MIRIESASGARGGVRQVWVGRAILLALLVAVLLSRWPIVASRLADSDLSTDEPDVTWMALDRFFGLPLSNTHWPALTNQALMVPTIGLDFLMSGGARTPSGFATYAAAQYRDPAHLVRIHRAWVVVLTTLASGGLALVVLGGRDRGGNGGWTLRAVAAAALVLLLQSRTLVIYGTLAYGNGPALATVLAIFAICLARGRAEWRMFVAGVLLGLSLASRNTSVLAAPMLLGFVVEAAEGSVRRMVSLLALVVVGAVLGSLPLGMIAALDPIRWAKANLGNFVKTGAPVGLLGTIRVLVGSAGWWYWLATLAAVVTLILRRRHRAVVGGWLAGFVIAWLLSSRSPLVGVRYFDAVVAGAAVLMALAILSLERSSPASADETRSGPRTPPAAWAALAGALVIAVFGWIGAAWMFGVVPGGPPLHDRDAEQAATALLATVRPGASLIVDRAIFGALRSHATSASLRTAADQTDSAMRSGAGLKQFVAQFRLPPEIGTLFAASLTEKEQAAITRDRVAAIVPPPATPALELTPCGDSISAQRFGCLAVGEVPAALRAGDAEEAILPRASLEDAWLEGIQVQPLGDGTYVRVRVTLTQAGAAAQ